MTQTLQDLEQAVRAALGDAVKSLQLDRGELTLTVSGKDIERVAQRLRDDVKLQFEQLIDLCGMDYSAHQDGVSELAQGPRYAVVLHLLSVSRNWRLRVRFFADNDDWPVVPSLNGVWAAANWYEREAFDLYGIVFEGHEDLRRILTDYGFIGHPFRKDFPVSGHVEMRYDEEQKRVIYQPVTIEPREITPRIIREEHYGGLH
jgi:NADH-quinone oxidoreductase subunit C